MHFKPALGWQTFNYSDELVELIATRLTLAESSGIWEYYNFDGKSSVWCSDETSATNQLLLKFDSEQDDAKVESLAIEMTNNSGQHFKQLFKLKNELKRQFDIRGE